MRDYGLIQNKVDSYTQCLAGFVEAQSTSKIPIMQSPYSIYNLKLTKKALKVPALNLGGGDLA